MHTRTTLSLVAAATTTLAACSLDPHDSDNIDSVLQDVTVVEGNPTCAELGLGDFEIKFDDPVSGTFTLDGFNAIEITTDGTYLDFVSEIGIDATLVKGGPRANVYEFDPEVLSAEGLHAPINANTGEPYGISHVTFCFDYELMVSKTADAAFRRSYDWGIDKSSEISELTLAPGQQYLVEYAVSAVITGYEDDGFSASGTITILNPAPVPATLLGVIDTMDGEVIGVECGVDFPYELAAHATMECTYHADLADNSDRVNEVEVPTAGEVGPGSASADLSFADAAMEEIDPCIDLDDSLYGPLGAACVIDAPKVFVYSLYVGSDLVCGDNQVVNVASFVAIDTGASGSDSWTIDIEVPCATGCTLTQGYWKTHSEFGPAPYDDTWAQLAEGASTPLFDSGKTYYEALWTPPAGGNAYWILAHQYIAAVLNQQNGADTSDVDDALATAADLLAAYSPEYVATLRGKSGNALRNEFTSTAGELDAYNNGLTGPGHCDE